MADGLRLNNDRKTMGPTNMGMTLGGLTIEEDYGPKIDFRFRSEPARNSGSVVLNHKPIGGLPQFNRFAPAFNAGSGFQASGGYGSSGGSGSSDSSSDDTVKWVAIGSVALIIGFIVFVATQYKCGPEPSCRNSGNRHERD